MATIKLRVFPKFPANVTGTGGVSVTYSLGAYSISLSPAGAADILGIPFPISGTLATVANKLSVFAATTSAELAGVISDETGTGPLVFATAPAFTSYVEFPEISSPSNPAANIIRIFSKDVAGVTHLFTRDSAGTEIDITASISAAGVSSINGLTGALIMPWTNVRLAKTAAYTVVNGDSGKTIALAGSAFYGLTFSAASGYDSNFSVTVVNNDTGRAKTLIITGGTNVRLYPGQTAVVYNDNNVWKVIHPERWHLTGTVTVNVDPAGNDANDGLATGAGNAFLTLQAAFDEILRNYDQRAQSAITIQLADGTYTAGLHASAKPVGAEGGAHLIIQGNAGSITGVTISTTSTDCIAAFIDCTLQVKNMTLITTTGGNCINAGLGARIYVDHVRFGACAGSHVVAAQLSYIQFVSEYDILGGAATAHIYATGSSYIEHQGAGGACQFVANVAWGYMILADSSAGVNYTKTVTTNGAVVTGQKYLAQMNGTINTGGATLPGSVAGATSTGGQYV